MPNDIFSGSETFLRRNPRRRVVLAETSPAGTSPAKISQEGNVSGNGKCLPWNSELDKYFSLHRHATFCGKETNHSHEESFLAENSPAGRRACIWKAIVSTYQIQITQRKCQRRTSPEGKLASWEILEENLSLQRIPLP